MFSPRMVVLVLYVRQRTDSRRASRYLVNCLSMGASSSHDLRATALRKQRDLRHAMKSILDPSFRYTASFNTDVGKTFARIRRVHRQDAERALQVTAEALVKVSPILRKRMVSG